MELLDLGGGGNWTEVVDFDTKIPDAWMHLELMWPNSWRCAL